MPEPKAPFSFHCTVCFELLNLTNRAPIVLPCGHTYICQQCANRLDKCMVCRIPLEREEAPKLDSRSLPPIGNAHSFDGGSSTNSYSSYGNGGGEIRSWRDRNRPRVNTLWSSGYSSRSRHQQNHAAVAAARRREQLQQHGPPPIQPSLSAGQTTTIRLPTPKNHVLMCLIEATQKSQGVQENPDDSGDGYESGDDEELVLQGLQVMGSSSGTYMVRATDGLIVHPLKKSRTRKMNGSSVLDEGYRLEYGQTVQIFLFENGIATVARGAGCILVDNASQLVKVGEVTDEVCKFEAVSMALSSQLKELVKKIDRIERAKESVDGSLVEALENSDGDSPFGPVPDPRDDNTTPTGDKSAVVNLEHYNSFECVAPITGAKSFDEKVLSMSPGGIPIHPTNAFEMYNEEYGPEHQQGRHPDDESSTSMTGRIEMPTSIPPLSYRQHRRQHRQDDQDHVVISALASACGFLPGFLNDEDGANITPPMSPSAQRFIREARGEIDSPPVDFASGMSCHRGLNRSARHHFPRSPRTPRRDVLSYSSQLLR